MGVTDKKIRPGTIIQKKNNCEVAVHFNKEIMCCPILILLLLKKIAMSMTIIALMIVYLEEKLIGVHNFAPYNRTV